ncbi:hypothetical protein ACVWZ4_000986 [Bradyrhizobium sp. USDA 4472]
MASSVFEDAYRCAALLLFGARPARSGSKQVPINLGMRISTVPIFDVYSRTIESASASFYCREIAAEQFANAKLCRPVSNRLLVQRIRGVLKMFKKQFGPMPLRCAIDEGPRLNGLPQDHNMPDCAARGGRRALWRKQDLACPIASKASSDISRAWHIRRIKCADKAMAPLHATRGVRAQNRGAELRHSMAARSSIHRGSAGNEAL